MITRWGLKPHADTTNMALQEFAHLPLAAQSGKTTQQTVLGMVAYAGGWYIT